MKRIFSLVLALALLLTSLPLALGEEISYVGVVTGGTLHMRKEPSPSGKVITSFKAGTQVDILENDGTWCKVKRGNSTGYMMTQYLTIKANYDHLGWGSTPKDGTILNVHAQPDAASSIVYKCLSGEAFELVAQEGGWYKVRFGRAFGYVPQSLIAPIAGDFALGMTADTGSSSLTLSSLRTGPREVGAPLSVSRQEGTLPCALTYPDLDLPEADERMAQWIADTLSVFRQDYESHHAGEEASCTVEYQSLAVDEKYFSVLLMAEYKVGALSVQTLLPLNGDRQTGKLLSGQQLFSDSRRALFCLESAMGQMMSVPTDGYASKPQDTLWNWALLTRKGVEVCLPRGQYLPAGLGSQRLLLPYAQVAETLTLDSPLIASFIRVIDPTRPMIALTFDDGPSEETERILDVLQQYNARATFCVLGSKAETYSETIKRAIAQGNEIACHTWNHKKLTELSASSVRSQLQRTIDAVREVTGGYEIKVLRPPYGSTNKQVRNICADMGLTIAHWKLDTQDWSTRSTSKTYRAIIRGAENGVVVLCHDLYSSTASAIEQAVPELVEKGYQLVTFSELMSFHKDGAKPGTVYAYLDPANIAPAK